MKIKSGHLLTRTYYLAYGTDEISLLCLVIHCFGKFSGHFLLTCSFSVFGFGYFRVGSIESGGELSKD